MGILYCLGVALGAFCCVAGLSFCVFVLRWILWPVGWLIGRYWDWLEGIQSEFVQVLLAVTPIIGLVAAVLAFLICLGSPK